MKLTWYKTAALVLEEDGYRLAVDPFVAMTPIGVSDEERYHSDRAAALRDVDAVLVTHGHFDHIYDIPSLYQDKAVDIYATLTPCASLKAHGVSREKLNLIAPGDMLSLGPFDVKAYQGRHCQYDFGVAKQTVLKKSTAMNLNALLRLWKLNKAYPENGETLFYDIRVGGRHIQLMGSMGTDDNTFYPAGADLLILPFQGTGNPAKTVAPIVAALRPRRILLDHYDDAFPPLSSQIRPEDFIVRMNGKGILTGAMEDSKAYEI